MWKYGICAQRINMQKMLIPKEKYGQHVFEAWRNCMLPCSSVALTSKKDCTICLPFSKLQFAEVFNQDDTMPIGTIYHNSAGWLARALAQSTEVEFRRRGDPYFVGSIDVT